MGRIVRPEIAELLRCQSLGETRPEQLVAAIAGQAQRHEFQPDERVGGCPRLRVEPQQQELEG
jgi:hypothetical protein